MAVGPVRPSKIYIRLQPCQVPESRFRSNPSERTDKRMGYLKGGINAALLLKQTQQEERAMETAVVVYERRGRAAPNTP